MVSLSSLKPFFPLLITFVLPRAITYYRTIKTAVRTRPPARPLPSKTGRGLNVLFVSICVFLLWTMPFGSVANRNIFVATNARLHVPTDVLFSRLAMIRPLTPFDEQLKTKITTPNIRQLYLRFGPQTLMKCSFCHPEDESSYILYHLPTNVLLPHLFHLLALGLATSEGLAGIEAQLWRGKSTIGALSLALLDIYVTMIHNPKVDGNLAAPDGLFWQAGLIRPLVLGLFDVLLAFFIYANATNKFLLFASSVQHDSAVAKRLREEMLNQTNVSLQLAQTKLRAFAMARNASVREPRLKAADDEYWRAVVSMEGPVGGEGVFEEEEVQAALARSYGSGLDVERMTREAESFVTSITQGLDVL